ncbi:MAG: c-type cytochrome domain-containing protein, partial [Verrucomicrobiota bacterium]|nr:c-type cytochrome domain-containing protein [Verrucomicrobiota bacterium]
MRAIRPVRHALVLAGTLVVSLSPSPAVEEQGARLFALKVFPLLKKKCFACHGEDPGKVEGKLNLLTREGMLRGGENSQRVLVVGRPKQSDLYRAITWEDGELEMPPKENDRLSQIQVALVRDWIAAGAPWPDEKTRRRYLVAERAVAVTEDGEIFRTSGGLSEEWTYRRYRPEDLWALRPVAVGAVPGEEHPIDAFLDSRRKEAGFEGAEQADPLMLIRRAT